jgi:signal transduction histidine kinase
MQFHTPTIFLVLSFLYIMMPIAVWLALSNQPTKTIVLWCVGGELLAIGLLLIGLRPFIPAWVSYTLANALAWMAILIQASALRHALKLNWHARYMVLVVAAWLAVFEYFRTVLENAHLRFAWSVLFFVVDFAYISYLARRISLDYDLKSGRWLSVVYGIAAVVMLIRMLRILLGVTEPDAMAQGVDSLMVGFSGFMVSVLGNFSFVGLDMERTTKKEMQAAAERARKAESFRLSEQIAQLERQRTLGVMSYSFAHELSQPLTAILMDAHAVKSSLTSNHIDVKSLSESIEDIERNAARTGQLIDRIRNFIRPTQDHFEPVDMKLLVRDVKQLLLYEIRIQKIEFEWDFEQEECVVLGDRVQLSQIVLNVYRNAIQALSDSQIRKIFVSLDSQAQRVVLRVRDSGPGLSEKLKHNIGMPFVTSKKDGLGVGLSISKTIAEKHGGSLSITNAMDGGALVELNLPALSI